MDDFSFSFDTLERDIAEMKGLLRNLDVLVRANQVEIAKLQVQSRLAGAITGFLAGSLASGFISLLLYLLGG